MDLPLFQIVVAADQNRGIGKNGQMPWHIVAEAKYFSRLTKTTKDSSKQNAVIMGRTTWESLPEKFRPLPGRLNIVLTRDRNYPLPQVVRQANSLNEGLEIASVSKSEKIFVIGGGQIYEEAINHAQCAGIYLTEIKQSFDCDTFFPEIDHRRFEYHELSSLQEERGVMFQFLYYQLGKTPPPR